MGIPQLLWAGLTERERFVLDGPRMGAIQTMIRTSPPEERAAVVAMEIAELAAWGVRSSVGAETCNAIRRRVEGMERGPRDL